MKIKSLRIRNFQSIKDITIYFDENGVFKLDGANNIGKSKIVYAFNTLCKNVSNLVYKDFIRDDCSFFIIDFEAWDGSTVTLSRGAVDYYEWKLCTGEEGRADKTGGKVPHVLENYFNLYHEKEKTGEILNIRLDDSPLLFAATTAGDNYYILQKALGTEEFLLATKQANKQQGALSKEIKLIEQYAEQEEENLSDVTARLATESRALHEVERYENVLKAECNILETLVAVGNLSEELKVQGQKLKEAKQQIEDLHLADTERELQEVKVMSDGLTIAKDLSRLNKEAKELRNELKDVDVNAIHGELVQLDSVKGVFGVFLELEEMSATLSTLKDVLGSVTDFNELGQELVLLGELKELMEEAYEIAKLSKGLKDAKAEYDKAVQMFEDFKEELGVCPTCGGALTEVHVHS